MFGCPECGCEMVRTTIPEGHNLARNMAEADRMYILQIDCPGCGRIFKPYFTDEVWVDGKKTYATRNMRFN